MKKYIFLLILVLSSMPITLQAQWLEVFYAFEIKDADGNFIDSTNSEYKMTPVKWNVSSEVLLDIDMCENNKTWSFMEGYRDFDKINKLKIERLRR